MNVDWLHAYEIERKVQEIISQQQIDGWKFDTKQAKKYAFWLRTYQRGLYNRIRRHLRQVLIKPYNNNSINRPFLISGEYNQNVIKWMKEDVDLVGGPFTRIDWEDPNLSSEKQLKELLFDLGWKPTQWNYKKNKLGRKVYDENKNPIKTSPKLTEDSYSSLKVGVGPDIAMYLKAGHRASQIEGWLKVVDENDFIHAPVNPLGTPTGRMRHSVIVNVPKNKKHVYFGRQMRGLFIVRPGRALVGHDASGLEARIMGHYLDDEELIYELLHGDFHNKFWQPIIEFIDNRDNAKNVEYA